MPAMGKASRPSRTDIIAKRARQQQELEERRARDEEVAAYPALLQMLTGGHPLDAFDDEVRDALLGVVTLDEVLTGRGWMRNRELEDGSIVMWEWEPSRATEDELYQHEDDPEREEVTGLLLALDRDYWWTTVDLSPVGAGSRIEDTVGVPRAELTRLLPAIEALRHDTAEKLAALTADVGSLTQG